MLHDVEFFKSRVGEMDGFDDAAEYLIVLIQSKQGTNTEPDEKKEPMHGDFGRDEECFQG